MVELRGNERRNSILMISHYQDLSSASDRLKKVSLAAQLIRSTTQIISMVFQPRSQVLSHGISELVPQTSFRWEPSGGVEKCRQFFQSTINPNCSSHIFFVETNVRECQLNTVFTAKKLV